MLNIHVSSITINSATPAALAQFWSRFLGVDIVGDSDGFTRLAPTRPGAPRIGIQRVDNPTEGPRRVHADFDVPDLDAATERARSLGATAVERHSIGAFSWQVMADPEGNEFCLAVH